MTATWLYGTHRSDASVYHSNSTTLSLWRYLSEEDGHVLLLVRVKLQEIAVSLILECSAPKDREKKKDRGWSHTPAIDPKPIIFLSLPPLPLCSSALQSEERSHVPLVFQHSSLASGISRGCSRARLGLFWLGFNFVLVLVGDYNTNCSESFFTSVSNIHNPYCLLFFRSHACPSMI